MASPTDLACARANHRFLLEQAVEGLAADGVGDGHWHYDATRCHRRLGIAALLEDLDRDAFVLHLGRSGTAYLELLDHAAAGRDIAPQWICPSRNDPLSDALAAGCLPLARRVAAAIRPWHPAVEYEEDALRGITLAALVDPEHDHGRTRELLAAWAAVAARAYWLDVASAIAARDAERFTTSFAALLARRATVLADWRLSTMRRPDIDATEGAIFIEGLALLRLAELRGLPTDGEHPLCPAVARVPTCDPSPSWADWQDPSDAST